MARNAVDTLARMTSHNLPAFEPDTAYEVWGDYPEGGLRRIRGGMSDDDAYDLAQRYAKASAREGVTYYVVAASTTRMWKETVQ